MRSLRIVLAGAALLLVTPGAAPGQAPAEPGYWLQMTFGNHSSGLSNTDIYVERLGGDMFLRPAEGAVGPCIENCLVYKVEDVEYSDGTVGKGERLLSPMEVAVLTGGSPGSDVMVLGGWGMMAFQKDFNLAMTGSDDPTGGIDRVQAYRMGEECYPSDFDGQLPDNARRCSGVGVPPWMDPFSMMYAGGAMILDAGMAMREAEQSLANSADLAQEEADAQTSVFSQLEESGTEDVSGRNTIHYTKDGLDLPVEVADDQQFEIDRVGLWVDPEELVLVKHRWEGTATADGQSREFFIEVVNSDFRNPPGCGEMYKPYRRVQRMGGILDDAQMAEMERARQQLEEFERQMAELPAEQRAMAERMMGSKMDAVRSMAEGGAIENVTEVEEILCDPDLKALFGVETEDGKPDGRLARIQRNLLTLGYEPGNTRGEFDDATRAAISEFQADRGLTVTGEPSAELEELLAAEVEERASG